MWWWARVSEWLDVSWGMRVWEGRGWEERRGIERRN
jgi:hypothetical protein